MQKTNIVIIGFMGTGKSTVAKLLAQELKLPYVETDLCIEAKEQTSISDIFQTKGEAYFREVETAVIREVSQRKGVIISTGGGAVLKQENINFFKKIGTLFCLTANADEIYQRLAKDTTRPLLQTSNPREKIKDLLELRQPFYAKADHQIETTGIAPEQIVQTIKRILCNQ
jgi:shikimate kinase